jgi:hypothetical protein
MRRRYPPYSKWLGTAFARLPGVGGLQASLAGAISGGDWPTREQYLGDAYEAAATMHNELGVTQPLDTHVRCYYDRPYRVIGAERFASALRQAIVDPAIGCLPDTGAVDQFIDSTDATTRPRFLRAYGVVGETFSPVECPELNNVWNYPNVKDSPPKNGGKLHTKGQFHTLITSKPYPRATRTSQIT